MLPELVTQTIAFTLEEHLKKWDLNRWLGCSRELTFSDMSLIEHELYFGNPQSFPFDGYKDPLMVFLLFKPFFASYLN